MKNSEQQLVRNCIGGDAQAQRVLYERYRHYWYSVSLRYSKSRDEANDILQEGLITIYKDMHQFKGENFKGWSSRVLINSALRYLKKQSWHRMMSDVEEGNDMISETEDVIEMMSAKDLLQVIQKLPVGYKLVFNMYAIEGYSHKEIAKMLQISEGTSKSQLFKARKALKEILESYLVN